MLKYILSLSLSVCIYITYIYSITNAYCISLKQCTVQCCNFYHVFFFFCLLVFTIKETETQALQSGDVSSIFLDGNRLISSKKASEYMVK